MDLFPQRSSRATWQPKTAVQPVSSSSHHIPRPLPLTSTAPPAAGPSDRERPGLKVEREDDNATLRIQCEMDLSADLHHLSVVRERAASLADAVGFGEDSVDEVRLAVGEAYVNAVRHGSCVYEGGPTRDGAMVLVRMFSDEATVVVEVKDSGEGFDIDSLELPPVDRMSPGGRGLFFMKIAMDEVDFDFAGGGTLVRMTKHLGSPGIARAD